MRDSISSSHAHRRVLHLTRDFPPRSTGGLSTAVAGLVEASARIGISSFVLSFDNWRPKARPHSTDAPVLEERDFGALVRLSEPSQLEFALAHAQSGACDVVHVHDGMLWPFAQELRRALGLPLLYMVHVYHRRVNALRAIDEETASLRAQELALAEADAVLSPSYACTASIQADYPGLHVMTARLGISLSTLKRHTDLTRTHSDKEVLLYVGRFSDIKGTREFFRVAARLLSERPRLHVQVVGGVPANMKAERRWLRQWGALCPPGARARVNFQPWLSSSELSRFYQEANVLLIPSWTETFGLVALEGMLHGTPILASGCSALREMLGDGQRGSLCDARDDVALYEATTRLLDDPALAQSLGIAAATYARERCVWSARIRDFERAYEALLDRL